MSTPKRPRDPNQLAKTVVDEATGQAKPVDPDEGKDVLERFRSKVAGGGFRSGEPGTYSA